jgi:threonine synthase
MDVISTRNPALHATFRHALTANLTPDGGLWIPARLAPFADLDALLDLPFAARSAAILQRVIGDEFGHADLAALAHDAFTFPVPLRQIDAQTWALELFHGPTLAFKDFGARLLARLLALHDRDVKSATPRTILTATSGDTGAAVAHAFWHQPGIRVVVLYPHGRVSAMQERQFAALGDNVVALAVDGSFDDCQALAKACFNDAALSAELRLTSANSINIARILAQVLYYFEIVAALRLAGERRAPVVAVPSGNFGNLCAGLYAQRRGLPIAQFVAATNANRTVPDFLRGDAYRTRPSVATISNAMDVGAPSNWERIAALFGHDRDAMRAAMRSGSATDDETRAEIARLWQLGWLADPHAAVASAVLQKVRHPGELGVFLATAHPAKFPEDVEKATGVAVQMPPELAQLLDRPLLAEALPNEVAALQRRLRR